MLWWKFLCVLQTSLAGMQEGGRLCWCSLATLKIPFSTDVLRENWLNVVLFMYNPISIHFPAHFRLCQLFFFGEKQKAKFRNWIWIHSLCFWALLFLCLSSVSCSQAQRMEMDFFTCCLKLLTGIIYINYLHKVLSLRTWAMLNCSTLSALVKRWISPPMVMLWTREEKRKDENEIKFVEEKRKTLPSIFLSTSSRESFMLWENKGTMGKLISKATRARESEGNTRKILIVRGIFSRVKEKYFFHVRRARDLREFSRANMTARISRMFLISLFLPWNTQSVWIDSKIWSWCCQTSTQWEVHYRINLLFQHHKLFLSPHIYSWCVVAHWRSFWLRVLPPNDPTHRLNRERETGWKMW